MIFLDPRLWLALIVALAGAFGTGYWRGQRAAEAQRLGQQLDATREAARFEAGRQRNLQGAINGYITARERAQAGERAAAVDLQRVRDALARSEHRAADAAAGAACAAERRRFEQLAELCAEGASLVEEGGRLVGELGAKAAALRQAGQR